jgi:hypothetical protein
MAMNPKVAEMQKKVKHLTSPIGRGSKGPCVLCSEEINGPVAMGVHYKHKHPEEMHELFLAGLTVTGAPIQPSILEERGHPNVSLFVKRHTKHTAKYVSEEPKLPVSARQRRVSMQEQTRTVHVMEQEVPEDMVQMSREEFEEAVQQAATVMAQQQIQAHVQQGSIVQADEVIRLMRTALNGAPKAPENPLIDQVLNIVNYGVNSPMTKRHGR